MRVEKKTIILGDEYDEALRDALRIVLVRNGAVGINKFFGVGGSQEVETLEVRIGDDLITIEAETFVGLTITGSSAAVDSLALQVKQRL
ncbi:hypothetical protein [Achromobacter denitrificans]|uniref:hypothetical protein n=1 Tax=Achromobacter denitrificans TaxID=32002 RepID=UPI001124DEDD|nr:hypothetical protein [Achromobacter denitrificans]